MTRSLDRKARWTVLILGLLAAACSSRASSSGTAAATAEDHPPSAAGVSASASGDVVAASPSGDLYSSPAANGKLTVGTDALFSDQAAIVEGFDDGSAAFAVAPDGPVKIALADTTGAPIPDRGATLTYEIPETGKSLEVPLHVDPTTHYLIATGPELASVITPVHYEIKGGSRVWVGVLQLPAGGTKALNDSATAAAAVHATPIVGPHGGRIERIGNDDVELLVDKDAADVHAWIIVDGKAIAPEDRTIVTMLDDRRVELTADASGTFYAKVSVDAGFSLAAVHKVTCVLTRAKSVWFVEYGFRPHVYVYAPRAVVDVGVSASVKGSVAVDVHTDDDQGHGDHDHDAKHSGEHHGNHHGGHGHGKH